VILAIDPGLNGAYALLNGPLVVALDHIPVHKTQHGKTAKIRSELNLHGLRDMWGSHCITCAYLERVSAMPRQGVTSMFRFAEAAGGLYGLLVGLGIPVTFVRPQVWQRFHGIGGVPDAARQRAVQLYPTMSAMLSRKKDDQRADALLIASYGASLSNIPASSYHMITPKEVQDDNSNTQEIQ
jgi:hypothetical protein